MEVGGYPEVYVLPNNYGYYMRQDQHLSLSGINLDIDNAFSLGFWLYSTNSGIVINPISGKTESIEMPILDLRYSDLSFLTIKEISRENGKNYIKVELDKSSYVNYSSDYTVNLWHYIWIIYNGWEGIFQIYFDGFLCSSSLSVGIIPTALTRR